MSAPVVRGAPLGRAFFARNAVTVGRELLGCTLVHILPDGTELAGVIVETEAYREDDPASHSHRGETPRSRVMFGPPGVSYVYVIYGMCDCFNIVCEAKGVGAAVLIRAVEPVVGWRTMWERRYPAKPMHPWIGERAASVTPERLGRPPAVVRNLTSGPGKLCRALGITREAHNGAPLAESADPPPDGLSVVAPSPGGGNRPLEGDEVTVGRRVGITKATELEWRFSVTGNPFVSR